MSDFRLLQNFVVVYRNQSFRSAAEVLGVAQSSVTKRVQALESELQMRLFNRTTRAVEPTDGARELIEYAEATLKSASAFEEQARLLAGGELGAIRVGAIALAAETLIVDALARLAETHPNLDVEVIVGSSDVYRDLATGRCDLVVGDEVNFAQSAYASSLRMEPVSEEELVFFHRRSHPARNAADLAALLSFPLAIPSRYFNENQLFATLAKQTDPPASPRYRLNSLSACVALAASSDVVTLGPKSLFDRPVLNGKRSAVVASTFATGIELCMVMATVARNAPTPAVRAVREALGYLSAD